MVAVWGALLVLAVCTASPVHDVDSFSFLETSAMTGAGLNVSSLVVNAGPGLESKIVLGDAAAAFGMSVKGDTGDFEINHQAQKSLVITKKGDVEVFGKLTSMGAVRIDGKITYRGVDQWRLAAFENFNNGASGWSNDTLSVCGNDGKKLLGGYGKFAGGEVTKTFHNLPEHTQVRLKANYHFIDAWGGETAYAKIDHRLMWTDSFDQQTTKVGIQVCGSPAPESKLSTPIDVVMPHTCATPDACSVTIGFGSTLVLPPTEQSWAVSDVMLYVR